MTRPSFSLPALLILVGLWLCGASAAQAQTLVYRMEFRQASGSINFEMFDQAYFVVGGLGGEGTFIFTYREDGRDFYLTSSGGGTLFFAVRPGQDKAVIRATAENATGQSHYLAVGDLDGRISANLRGQRVTLGVSEKLTGWVLASDPEEDVEFTGPDSTLGVAGFATLRATLDHGRTRDANRANLDVAATVAALETELERSGFENGTPEGDGGDGEGEEEEASAPVEP
ncbi:MAG: hypothetical protein JNK37_14865 [Verrucomicrobiales bacterium]|nr:hypothetical protein [Verrucomicrobiales bacterium]